VLIDAWCIQLIRVNSGYTDQKPTKFIPGVARSLTLLTRPSAFQCSTAFLNADVYVNFRQIQVPIGTQMSSIISGVTRQTFTKFLHYVATSSRLLTRTFRLWYCNSFLSDSAKNASGISRRSWHFPKIDWLPWQRPLTNRKTMYRSIICTQSAFIWYKDRKIGQDILRYSTKYAGFLPCRTKSSQMSPVTGPKFTKYLHDIEASLTLLIRTLR